jgi:hypothetical protein
MLDSQEETETKGEGHKGQKPREEGLSEVAGHGWGMGSRDVHEG